MTTTKVTLLGAAAWAAAFIVASIAFRGQPLGDWIEGVLFVGAIVFLAGRAARTAPSVKAKRW